ncbi:MAG: hypothetical protein KME26_14780 [Oscillatoria princeps RMCB-10]|nr:hypothetical protein [Oscillatoria princeps RMCB-10]
MSTKELRVWASASAARARLTSPLKSQLFSLSHQLGHRLSPRGELWVGGWLEEGTGAVNASQGCAGTGNDGCCQDWNFGRCGGRGASCSFCLRLRFAPHPEIKLL